MVKMNIRMYANAQQNYLRAALEFLQAELDFRTLEAWDERLRQRLEQHIIDWFELLKVLEEADDANYERARREPSWDFETADAEIEHQLRKMLVLGQRYLALCELLTQRRLVISQQTHLAARIRDLERLLNWSDEYANTLAYRQLAEETWCDYKSGLCEEGGWEL